MNRQIITVKQTLQTICSEVYAEQREDFPYRIHRTTPNTINPIICIDNTQRNREGGFSFDFLHKLSFDFLHMTSILFS